LVRQIAGFEPSELTFLESSEFNLYSIDQEISVSHPGLLRRTALCDVRNLAALDRWFDAAKPEIVFHAAAVKHVPMIEAHPLEGVAVNIVGTRNVAEASLKHGVSAMVMISTDKAVNPRNVMGASKRLAESFCQALDVYSAKLPGDTTRFFTVRFGNVLGSTGSVVPLFQKQLAAGGPLTVTHPDITRYFMTIPEAVQLILQAAAMGVRDAGDRGKIFVLDMGEPIKIVDLARQMIRLSGRRPDIDVKIAFVGLRPGEKLFEELLHDREELLPSPQKGVLLAMPRAAELQLLRRDIEALAQFAATGDREAALATLCRCVPEYVPDFAALPSGSSVRDAAS
jgi:O-antigen biosynthesis protein WbqV